MPAETIQIRNPTTDAAAAAGLIPAPHHARKALEETLYELCLNVLQWAESPGRIVIDQSGEDYTLTVADDGIGIPETMRRIDAGLSNQEAVTVALEAGNTASGDPWRGFGLGRLVDLSSRDGFATHLVSRDVAVWISGDRRVFCSKSGGSIAGTRIQIIYSPSEPS